MFCLVVFSREGIECTANRQVQDSKSEEATMSLAQVTSAARPPCLLGSRVAYDNTFFWAFATTHVGSGQEMWEACYELLMRVTVEVA